MATFVIGDVQGCFEPLLQLLDHIHFNPEEDTLWFTGDLVNRGPHSLEVLRFVSSLPRVRCVLGNHDLTLLALAYTSLPIQQHTLSSILDAPDREPLLTWLRQQPLLYEDTEHRCMMVHAGIPPQWSLQTAKACAKEVEALLASDNYSSLLENMFGNEPASWEDTLTGWARYRFILNGFTRLRFCDALGHLELTQKGGPETAPPQLHPWYTFPIPDLGDKKIFIGHWAALQGHVPVDHVEALDTGCYWGGHLTALRLEDRQRFCVGCT